MGRFREIVLRQPPLVAPAELMAEGGLTFGFVAAPELMGWTVTAYGPDGRRLGRPLKGLSDAARLTLTGAVAPTASRPELERLAGVWTRACAESHTNAEVLTGFADAAEPRR